jgi:UDPglucose 6-dehydrogenase
LSPAAERKRLRQFGGCHGSSDLLYSSLKRFAQLRKVSMPNGKDVSIFGAGYVGLVTGCGLAKLGHRVTLFDVDHAKIARLQSGEPPFYEPGLADLLVEGISAGKLIFTTDKIAAIVNHRYIFIAVPTPMTASGEANLSYLHQAVADITSAATAETLVIVKSTIPVGSFNELSRRFLNGDGALVQLVSNPEFVAEGNAVTDFFKPFRTVIGAAREEVAREVGALFSGLPGHFIYTDPNTAQMIKYGSNALLATRVAFINELSQICERLGADIADVSRAMLMDPRLGSGYLNAGIGFAGPCLPKDIAALQATATAVGLKVPLISSVFAQNVSHLAAVTQRLTKLLSKSGVVAVFGTSFKPNTDDVRNSFCIPIIEALAGAAGVVKVTDPRSLQGAKALLSASNIHYYSNPLDCAAGSDMQVFLTPWNGYKALDLGQLKKVVRLPFIFDAMQTIGFAQARAVGFRYEGIGRLFADEPPRFAVE